MGEGAPEVGRVALVTGGSSGLGLEIASGLAAAGVHVFIASRPTPRAEAAVARIRQASGSARVEFLSLDLGSFESIRACAREFLERGLPLHLLVNNAGLYSGRGTTREGFEQLFGTNYLGPFLLTQLLLERLTASSPSRILNVSSDLALRVEGIHWRRVLKPTPLASRGAYAASKFALVVWTQELARRLAGTGVTVNAVHPGFVRSNISLLHRVSPFLGIGAPAAAAARTPLALLLEPGRAGLTGAFVGPDGQPMPALPRAADAALALDLWERSRRWTGVARLESARAPVSYEPGDGIFGPFALAIDREALAATTRLVRERILPRAPVRSLARQFATLLRRKEPGSVFLLLVEWMKSEFYMERHHDSPEIRALCEDPALLAVLRERMGDDIVLWRSEIWVSHPAKRLLPVWHHDAYPKLVKGEGESFNVYIALTDVDEENGFEYLPVRSLAKGGAPNLVKDVFSGNVFFHVTPALEAESRLVALKAGEFILFRNELIHRSVHNTSGKVRVSLTLRVIQPTLVASPGYTPMHRPVRLGTSVRG
jgi:NAD(P)-dependent dehydrogenase (short-subunit alcohol dehydrogenase family)/ectoine hydroxylase-related dioxygenase (phytanoyl-CoA dioxygenase family)